MNDRTQINYLELEGLASKIMDTEDNIGRFSTALQCIAKRLRYCIYHFDIVQEYSTPLSLFKDRFHKYHEEELNVRDIYEANIAAFLHNLHAMLDSFPYLLNLICREVADIDDRNIGWNKSFVTRYKRYPFYDLMDSLSRSKHFGMLKGYSNHGKHKFLIRIINNHRALLFEDFQFPFDGHEELAHALLVKDFMAGTHDVLIPHFIYLINNVVKATSASGYYKALKSQAAPAGTPQSGAL